MKPLLGQKDVNPDSSCAFPLIPLSCAAENGHDGVVELQAQHSRHIPELSLCLVDLGVYDVLSVNSCLIVRAVSHEYEFCAEWSGVIWLFFLFYFTFLAFQGLS